MGGMGVMVLESYNDCDYDNFDNFDNETVYMLNSMEDLTLSFITTNVIVIDASDKKNVNSYCHYQTNYLIRYQTPHNWLTYYYYVQIQVISMEFCSLSIEYVIVVME